MRHRLTKQAIVLLALAAAAGPAQATAPVYSARQLGADCAAEVGARTAACRSFIAHEMQELARNHYQYVCVPQDEPVEQVETLFMTYLQEHRRIAYAPAEFVLKGTLLEAFPCK